MTRGGENALRARFALRAKCRVCLAWPSKTNAAFCAKREWSANRMTREGENALRARFALRAKCRVCLAWLLKRLLCRLAQQCMAWVYIFDGSLNSFD